MDCYHCDIDLKLVLSNDLSVTVKRVKVHRNHLLGRGVVESKNSTLAYTVFNTTYTNAAHTIKYSMKNWDHYTFILSVMQFRKNNDSNNENV